MSLRISKLPEHRTVREIASLIRRPHEELSLVVERIRAWTDIGLIKAAGRKAPGTGRKRRYGADATIDALILTALTDAGLAAIRAGHFKGVDGRTVMGLGRSGAAEVFNPAHAGRTVYLVISGTPTASIHTTAIAFADPVAPDLSKPPKSQNIKQIYISPDATWSVMLHLNKLFEGLRGVVAVSDTGLGSVKIDFIENGE
jgi:hypothetical protein